MNDHSLEFFRTLIDTAGPSGFEREVAAYWRSEAETFADEVDRDLTGNSYAWVRTGDDRPTVLVEGHIDEIGVQIMHIDPEGFVWIDEIGGWDAQVLTGQRIRIMGANGPVVGVIGRKAAHLLEPEDREKAPKMSSLWIDIGATSREDALKRVAIGDAGVVEAPFLHLTDDIVSSRALDNRLGAWVALEVARRCAETRPWVNVVGIASTQEETSYGGAFTAAFKVNPLVAIAVDGTHPADYPAANKKRDDEVSLGSGPVLTRGPSNNPVVYERLVAAAKDAGIAYTVQAAPKLTWTTADAMIRTGSGPATGLVSVPVRYMHSPNETLNLRDMDATVDLIVGFISAIDAETDFRP